MAAEFRKLRLTATKRRHHSTHKTALGAACRWVAAMQLSAVTSYLTANVAAIPLLWVLPLGVYLLTIILAFEFPGMLPRSIVARFLIIMLAGLGYALSKQDVEWPLRISIGFFLVEAFAVMPVLS